MNFDFRLGRRARAFTLVELLVVIAILLIVVALIVPAFNTIGKAQALTTGTNMVIDGLKSARQTALSQNRMVEVRFYRLPGTAGGVDAFRAMKTMQFGEDGTQVKALTKLERMPGGIVMSDNANFSTILDGATQSEDLPGAPGTPYRAVGFTPVGSTTLPPNTRWFVSLKAENAAPVTPPTSKPADNFATIQIDPINGAVKLFRP